MSLFETRLALMLANEPEWLRVPEGEGETRSFVGRYVRINNWPCALGRELGRGEEAIVFELIDLRTGHFSHVAKVCRHRPGTEAFRRWALPIRFQRNPASLHPDIELFPCVLMPIPGGVIKVQRYISPNPSTDWRTRLPIIPTFVKISGGKIGEAEALLDSLIAKHGEQAILLEYKGRLAYSVGKLDEALELLTHALASHVVSGSSSRYVAALCLAQVMDDLYRRDRSHGVFEASLTLDGGRVLRNVIFDPNTDDAALDDSLQDRSVFALLEVMGDLPYFVGGLNFMQESYLDLAGSASFKILGDGVSSVDPENPLMLKLREAGFWPVDNESRAGRLQYAPDQSGTQEEEGGPSVAIPEHVRNAVQRHDAAYKPETNEVREGKARVIAALSEIRRGREEVAEANLREAISLAPEAADHRIALATFLSSRGRDDEAIRVLSDAIRELEGVPILRLYLGSVLLKSGRLLEAERTLKKARPLLPEYENDIRLMMAEVAERGRVQ